MAHSRSSSTSDLHVYDTPTQSYSYGPPGSSSYSDTGSEPPSRRTSLAYEPALPSPTGAGAGGQHRPSPSIASVATTGASTTGAAGSRRSRARAFSFLLDSSPLPPTSHTPSPGGRRTSISTLDHSYLPFGGDAYDFALRAEEEEEDERVELSDSTPAGEAQQRRQYRQTFQPILKEELWWMGVSAATVLGLTAAAVVLSVAG